MVVELRLHWINDNLGLLKDMSGGETGQRNLLKDPNGQYWQYVLSTDAVPAAADPEAAVPAAGPPARLSLART